MNEDYINGIKFLLEKSKEQGINIRMCTWIPNVSKILSEHGLCYKFWYNVWNQKKVREVLFCENWYDVTFDIDKCLFIWGKSYEGHTFWVSMLSNVLGVHVSKISLSVTKNSRRRLYD